MNKCPIALQKQKRGDALAFSQMSYKEFDKLICRLCHHLKTAPQVLAFIPKGEVIDCALFFAAWRLDKTIYPISFRLPPAQIENRLKMTGAELITPNLSSQMVEIEEIDETRIATMIETSSGSKIVCHRLSGLISSAQAAISLLNLNPDDGYCLNLPLFHISGIALMLRTFIAGATLLLKEEYLKASHLSVVSTQLYRFNKENIQFPNLKAMLVGGGPFPKHLTDVPYPLIKSYGMTEAGSIIATETQILPHIDLKCNENGEILIQGPSLFSHYFGKNAHQGWFATGDLGKLENGLLTIIGRKDRQFISGGENIQPEEIENALLTIPTILEAKVSPLFDPEFGHTPAATITSTEPLSTKFLFEKLSEILPRYKIPKTFKFESIEGSKLAKLS